MARIGARVATHKRARVIGLRSRRPDGQYFRIPAPPTGDIEWRRQGEFNPGNAALLPSLPLLIMRQPPYVGDILQIGRIPLHKARRRHRQDLSKQGAHLFLLDSP